MIDIRGDFPFFNQKEYINFLDSAASSQKPFRVINKLLEFYSYGFSNIHRGNYSLSAEATMCFERVRVNTAEFINARDPKEIIFTKNATEAINLVASSFTKKLFDKDGGVLLLSSMEHHSNIIPWQQLCKEKKITLGIIPINKNGKIIYTKFEEMMSFNVKFVAITHMSNFFGSVVDIKRIVRIAKKFGAKVLVDACQSVAHMKIDVQSLNCDFLVFSSHKLYGPTGVGILYIQNTLLDCIDTYQTGGSMVKNVSFQETIFLDGPNKFEAGTPAIAEVIAFGEALYYLNSIDILEYWSKEKKIARYIKNEIHKTGSFYIYNNNEDSSIISFNHSKIHHSDIADILDKDRIAVRSGHHCVQPLMNFLKISGAVRISLGIYNNYKDANNLIESLKKVDKIFV